MSATRYFARMKGEVELEFVVPDSGPVQEIALDWSGHRVDARRAQ
ncbi:hypothetical protein [Nonomuraea lactucae]|nr:hypothetical protein [Nonomuraea lactucae]